jgi:hypothetical protein
MLIEHSQEKNEGKNPLKYLSNRREPKLISGPRGIIEEGPGIEDTNYVSFNASCIYQKHG